MPYTGALSQVVTLGVVVSASYRAGHALAAFRNDIGMTTAQIQAFNRQVSEVRSGLIRWGGAALVVGGVAAAFRGLAKEAAPVETAMLGIQLQTGATTKEMQALEKSAISMSARTRFSLVETMTQMQILMQSLQTVVPRGEQISTAMKIGPDVTAIASVLKGRAAFPFQPEATIPVMSALAGMFGARTPEEIQRINRMTFATFMQTPYAEPGQLQNIARLAQGVSPGLRPEEFFPLATVMMARGQVGGRQAGSLGRALEFIQGLIYYDPAMAAEMGGAGGGGAGGAAFRQRIRAGELLFGPAGRAGGGGMGGGRIAQVLGLRHRLGFDQLSARAMRGEHIPLAEEVAAASTIAKAMGEQAWASFLASARIPLVPRRFLAPLGRPGVDIPQDLANVSAEFIRTMGMVDDHIRLRLMTFEGASAALTSNFKTLASVVGEGLLPGFTAFKKTLGDFVAWISGVIATHPTAGKIAVQGGSLALAAALPWVGSQLGTVLGGGAALMGAAGLGAVLPWLGLAAGLAGAAYFAAPAVVSGYDWLTGYDRKGELERAARRAGVPASQIAMGAGMPMETDDQLAARIGLRGGVGGGTTMVGGVGGPGFTGFSPGRIVRMDRTGFHDITDQLTGVGTAARQTTREIRDLGEATRAETSEKMKLRREILTHRTGPGLVTGVWTGVGEKPVINEALDWLRTHGGRDAGLMGPLREGGGRNLPLDIASSFSRAGKHIVDVFSWIVGKMNAILENDPIAYGMDVNEERRRRMNWFLDGTSVKSLSAHVMAPETQRSRIARTQDPQGAASSVTHPSVLGMPGR